MNIFGLNPVVGIRPAEQKQRMLPPIAQGKAKACFAVTEPNTGLNTTQLKTKAERTRRSLHRQRSEGVDLDRAGRRQDAVARAHDATRRGDQAQRWPEPVLHRFGPQPGGGARDREDGPQGGRLQRAVHRRSRSAGRRSHRRRRARLQVHPARHESRADLDCGGSDRSRSRGLDARRRVRARSASSSAARSVRINRCSIRWRRTGWSSKPPD